MKDRLRVRVKGVHGWKTCFIRHDMLLSNFILFKAYGIEWKL